MRNFRLPLSLRIILAFVAFLAIMNYTAYTYQAAGKARVRGKVLTEAEEPIPNAKVILRSKLYQATITKTTDKDGVWVAVGIKGGGWDIDITAPGYYPKVITTNVSEVVRNKPVVVHLKKTEENVLTKEEAEKIKKLLLQGNEYFMQKQYDVALKEFKEVLKEHPEIYRLHLYIGNCYKEMEELDKAIIEYEIFYKKEPDSFEANISIADAYIFKREPEKAIEYLNKVDVNLITDSTMSYNFGNTYFDLGQPERAIRFFSHTISLNAEYSDAYYRLGLAYLNKGEIENAKINLQKFLELAPDSPEAEIAKEFLKNITQQEQ